MIILLYDYTIILLYYYMIILLYDYKLPRNSLIGVCVYFVYLPRSGTASLLYYLDTLVWDECDGIWADSSNRLGSAWFGYVRLGFTLFYFFTLG